MIAPIGWRTRASGWRYTAGRSKKSGECGGDVVPFPDGGGFTGRVWHHDDAAPLEAERATFTVLSEATSWVEQRASALVLRLQHGGS